METDKADSMARTLQGPGRQPATKAEKSAVRKKASMIPFTLLLAYLFLDYARPQDILSFLRALRLPGVAIGLLALSTFYYGRIRLRDRQTLLFLGLLGLMVIHGPIAVNNYWALMVFITMAMNFVVFLALSNHVDQPEKYEKLVKAWLLIHVFLAVIGIAKKGRGIGGFLNDENDFCAAMNMIIPLPFFLALNASGRNRLYYIALTCLYLFVILLTESRGGFVGLCAATLYCWLKTNRKVLTGLVLACLGLVAVVLAPASYWSEVRSITEEGASKGTGAERVYTWKVGWAMFLDNPIFGVGQGNFPYVFRKYEVAAGYGEKGYHGRSVAGRAAHSIYFTMLPELGLVGTGIILAMLAGTLKDLKSVRNRAAQRRKARPAPEDRKVPRYMKIRSVDLMKDRSYALSLALEGGLVSFLVSGGFISILYYPNLWILMGFAVSLHRIADQDAASTP